MRSFVCVVGAVVAVSIGTAASATTQPARRLQSAASGLVTCEHSINGTTAKVSGDIRAEFAYEDIHFSGVRIEAWDGDSFTIDLPWVWSWYGHRYTAASVGKTGVIAFGTTAPSGSAQSMPCMNCVDTGGEPLGATIATFWSDDLQSPKVNYLVGDDALVVEWFSDLGINASETYQFQTVLNKTDGSVTLSFDDLPERTSGYNVGWQDHSGTQGYQLAMNNGLAESEYTISASCHTMPTAMLCDDNAWGLHVSAPAGGWNGGSISISEVGTGYLRRSINQMALGTGNHGVHGVMTANTCLQGECFFLEAEDTGDSVSWELVDPSGTSFASGTTPFRGFVGASAVPSCTTEAHNGSGCVQPRVTEISFATGYHEGLHEIAPKDCGLPVVQGYENTDSGLIYRTTSDSGLKMAVESHHYEPVGPGWCRGTPYPSAVRVNGRWLQADDLDCQAACDLLDNCRGYARVYDPASPYYRRCYLHGPEIDASPDLVDGWGAFPRDVTEIGGSSCESPCGIVCMRKQQCMNNDPSCGERAGLGHCTTHAEMHEMCQQSCGLCSSTRFPIGEESEFTIRLHLQLAEPQKRQQIMSLGNDPSQGMFVEDGVVHWVGGGTPSWTNSSVRVLSDEWTSLAVTTSPPGTTVLYQDGSRVAVWDPMPTWAAAQITGNEITLLSDIGTNWSDCGLANDTDRVSARVSKIEMYNFQMSDAQVQTLESRHQCSSIAASHDSICDANTWLSHGAERVAWENLAVCAITSPITRVNLRAQPIGGEIPHQLMEVSTISDFTMEECGLSGTVPPLQGMTALARINIRSNNDLSGTFPYESAAQLQSLSEMWISNTKMSGTLPNTVGDLSHMRRWFAGFSPLSGTLPDSIGQLALLDDMHVGNTRLSGTLPPSVGNATSLSEFTIGFTEMQGTIPETITLLHNLHMLNVQETDMHGPISDELLTFFGSQEVDVRSLGRSYWGLTTPENKDALLQVGRGLTDNNISRIQWNVATDPCMDGWRGTYCDHDDILWYVRGESTGTKIRKLELPQMLLPGTVSPRIGDLDQLTTLNLKSNFLRGALPETLRNCTQLERLQLGDNLFGTQPVYYNLTIRIVPYLFASENTWRLGFEGETFDGSAYTEYSWNDYSAARSEYRAYDKTFLWPAGPTHLYFADMYGDGWHCGYFEIYENGIFIAGGPQPECDPQPWPSPAGQQDCEDCGGYCCGTGAVISGGGRFKICVGGVCEPESKDGTSWSSVVNAMPSLLTFEGSFSTEEEDLSGMMIIPSPPFSHCRVGELCQAQVQMRGSNGAFTPHGGKNVVLNITGLMIKFTDHKDGTYTAVIPPLLLDRERRLEMNVIVDFQPVTATESSTSTSICNAKGVDSSVAPCKIPRYDSMWVDVQPIECPDPFASPVPDGSACRCRPGFQTESDGTCTSCLLAGEAFFSGTGLECETCGPGTSPNMNRTSCRPCMPGSTGIDGTCSVCEDGTQNNVAHTACVVCSAGMAGTRGGCQRCLPGQQPNTDKTECISCATAELNLDGPTASANGLSCENCPAGTGINGDRSNCIPCAGSTFSTNGECLPCAPPNIVNDERTTCVPYVMGTSQPSTNADAILETVDTTNLLPRATIEVGVDDSDAVTVPGPAQTALIDSLKADMAAALGDDPSSIDITDIRPAHAATTGRRVQLSAQVAFDVVITGDDAASALSNLANQLADPTSPLRNGAVTSRIDSNVAPTFSLVCPRGLYRPDGAAGCSSCSSDAIPNEAQSRCVVCPPRQVADSSGTICTCDSGFFNSSAVFPSCHLADYTASAFEEGLIECKPCLGFDCVDTCQGSSITISAGWTMYNREDGIEAALFNCKNENACPVLVTTAVSGGVTEATTSNVSSQRCTDGYTDVLCGACAEGFVLKSTDGSCKQCGSTSGGGFLIAVLVIILIILFAKMMTSNAFLNYVPTIIAILQMLRGLDIKPMLKCILATMQVRPQIHNNIRSFYHIATPSISTWRSSPNSAVKFDVVSIRSPELCCPCM